MARPSKYKPEFVQKAVDLCLQGATDRELAEFFKVSESTLNLWKIEHAEFSEALKMGKELADERVVRSLYRRALGYSHDAVHVSNFQGQVTLTPIVEHYPPDTVAAIFWLKNRRPAEWRDVKALDANLSGSIGTYAAQPIPVEARDSDSVASPAGPAANGHSAGHG